jgi:hypothetical protein
MPISMANCLPEGNYGYYPVTIHGNLICRLKKWPINGSSLGWWMVVGDGGWQFSDIWHDMFQELLSHWLLVAACKIWRSRRFAQFIPTVSILPHDFPIFHLEKTPASPGAARPAQ